MKTVSVSHSIKKQPYPSYLCNFRATNIIISFAICNIHAHGMVNLLRTPLGYFYYPSI